MKILLAQNLPYIPTLTGSSKGNRLLLESLAAENIYCRIVTPASALKGDNGQVHLLAELNRRGIEPAIIEAEVTVFALNGVEVHAVTGQNQLAGYLAEQVENFRPDWILVSSEDISNSLLKAALQRPAPWPCRMRL
jgi:hypothetical protein